MFSEGNDSFKKSFFLVNKFERGRLHDTIDRAALEALRADAHGLVRTVFRGNTDGAKVRFEFPAGNTGDFRTNTTQVLRATTSLNYVPNLLAFTTKSAKVWHFESSLDYVVRCFI